MSTIVQEIDTNFTTAVTNFYSTASAGISTYVMNVAWLVLAFGLLLWAYSYMVGKQQAPITAWLTKGMYILVLLYFMSGGYLHFVGDRLFVLGDELSAAIGGGATSIATITALNDAVVNTLTIIWEAMSKMIGGFAFGNAAQLFVFGVLIAIVCYILIALTLCFYIFAKIGLSVTLAFGPLFLFGLISPHSRNYFYSWLNTVLYFVFYQVTIIAFIKLFLNILNQYFTALDTKLGGVSYTLVEKALNIAGLGPASINLVATAGPIIIIAFVMFFSLLQIPQLVSSMTSGSGGGFGSGAWMFRPRGGGGGGKTGGGGSAKPLMLPPPK